MSEPFLGELRLVGFNFAPKGWVVCDGQLLDLPQNNALFTLLGTTFGGDGVRNFGVPDLRGRSPVGIGTGPNGLSPIQWGEMLGSEHITLSPPQMPMHTHLATGTQMASSGDAPNPDPEGAIPAVTVDENRTRLNSYAPVTSGDVKMAPIAVTVQPVGSSQPVPLRNPCLGMRWCIAIEGIYPFRP